MDDKRDCGNCINILKGKYDCKEGMGSKYDKDNCPYYEKSFIQVDDLKCLDDLDIYQLMLPVANMVLYNWGLELLGPDSTDDYNLNCFNITWFKNKLIKELLK